MPEERMYHIGLTPKESAPFAILPGDPGRVEKIAAHLEQPHFVAQNREYTSWKGKLDGEDVLVMSTGMGGPSTAIGLEELKMIGVRRVIRVGTCGGMQLDVKAGDVIVAQAAVRMEGTSKEYLPIEFPACADFEITAALLQAAKNLELPHHVGVVQSKDSFYGQHSPERMPVGKELMAKWEAWKKGGCLASEMECAALFTVSSVIGLQAGAVLMAVWNQERAHAGLDNPTVLDTEPVIETAVEAIRLMIQR